MNYGLKLNNLIQTVRQLCIIAISAYRICSWHVYITMYFYSTMVPVFVFGLYSQQILKFLYDTVLVLILYLQQFIQYLCSPWSLFIFYSIIFLQCFSKPELLKYLFLTCIHNIIYSISKTFTRYSWPVFTVFLQYFSRPVFEFFLCLYLQYFYSTVFLFRLY